VRCSPTERGHRRALAWTFAQHNAIVNFIWGVADESWRDVYSAASSATSPAHDRHPPARRRPRIGQAAVLPMKDRLDKVAARTRSLA